MFKQILVAALGLLGVASSKVTGVDTTPPSRANVPDWMGGYTGSIIPRGFKRFGGTHGSTRIRRFRSLKNKARARRHGL